MQDILANCATNLSELQAAPKAVLTQAEECAVVVLNDNKPAAYLLSAVLYEQLLEQLDDHLLGQLVREREHEKAQAIEVSLDAL